MVLGEKMRTENKRQRREQLYVPVWYGVGIISITHHTVNSHSLLQPPLYHDHLPLHFSQQQNIPNVVKVPSLFIQTNGLIFTYQHIIKTFSHGNIFFSIKANLFICLLPCYKYFFYLDINGSIYTKHKKTETKQRKNRLHIGIIFQTLWFLSVFCPLRQVSFLSIRITSNHFFSLPYSMKYGKGKKKNAWKYQLKTYKQFKCTNIVLA